MMFSIVFVAFLLVSSAQTDYVIMSDANNFTAYKEASNGTHTPVQGIIETIEIMNFQPVESKKADPGIDVQLIVSPLNTTNSSIFATEIPNYGSTQFSYNQVPSSQFDLPARFPVLPPQVQYGPSSQTLLNQAPQKVDETSPDSRLRMQNTTKASIEEQTINTLPTSLSRVPNLTSLSSSNNTGSMFSKLYSGVENLVMPVNVNKTTNGFPVSFSGTLNSTSELDSNETNNSPLDLSSETQNFTNSINFNRTSNTLLDSFPEKQKLTEVSISNLNPPEVTQSPNILSSEVPFSNESQYNSSSYFPKSDTRLADTKKFIAGSKNNSILPPSANPWTNFPSPYKFDVSLNSTNETSDNSKASPNNFLNFFPLWTPPKSANPFEVPAKPWKLNPTSQQTYNGSGSPFSTSFGSFGSAGPQQSSTVTWFKSPTSNPHFPVVNNPMKSSFTNLSANSFENDFFPPWFAQSWTSKPATNYLFGSKSFGKGPYVGDETFFPQPSQNVDANLSHHTAISNNTSTYNSKFLNTTQTDVPRPFLPTKDMKFTDVEYEESTSKPSNGNKVPVDIDFDNSNDMNPTMYLKEVQWSSKKPTDEASNFFLQPASLPLSPLMQNFTNPWNSWSVLKFPESKPSPKSSNVLRVPPTSNVSFNFFKINGIPWTSTLVDVTKMSNNSPNQFPNLSFPLIQTKNNVIKSMDNLVDYDEPKESYLSDDSFRYPQNPSQRTTDHNYIITKKNLTDTENLLSDSNGNGNLMNETTLSNDYDGVNNTTRNATVLNHGVGVTVYSRVILCSFVVFMTQKIFLL